jgi:hypothetical protein
MDLRICGVYDERSGYRYYTSIADFLNGELTAHNHGRWFYAHAGGLFDMMFVFHYLMTNKPRGLRVDACMIGSAAVIIKISRGRRHWYFLDSFWLMRQPLRKIGKWMGYEKGGDGGIETFYAPLGELIDYNCRDVELLYKAIKHFECVLNDLGGELEKTVASSALKLFRMRYLKQEIQTSTALNMDARKAYIASRVEVFQKEVERCNYYDINSSFPYAMTREAPGNFLRSVGHLPDKGLYIARARIKVPECDVPPLPYRHPKDGRIYFPTGEWESWFTNTDIEFLQECGGSVDKVFETHIYEPFGDLKHYAEHIYDLRKNTDDEAYKQILKILLNSLYGKFAESSRKGKLYINPPSEFFVKHAEALPGGTGRRYVMPGVYELIEDKHIQHAHVPIAAHITAVARRNLTRYMREASQVYYCDTDGFAVPECDTWPDSKELGGLKFEKFMWSARFELPKLYAYQAREREYDVQPPAEMQESWTLKSKGFSKVRGHWEGERMVADDGEDARRLEYSDFCRLLDGQELLINQFCRVKQGMRRGLTHPHEYLYGKRLTRKQRQKRYFERDGTSRPWRMKEL